VRSGDWRLVRDANQFQMAARNIKALGRGRKYSVRS
jgi:hypothetical protein